MTSPFQAATLEARELDPRVERVRKTQIELRNAKQRKRDMEFEIAGFEIRLKEDLMGFYTLGRASELLKTDPRLLTTLIKNGAVFGMKVDGRWYVEKIDVDAEVDLNS